MCCAVQQGAVRRPQPIGFQVRIGPLVSFRIPLDYPLGLGVFDVYHSHPY